MRAYFIYLCFKGSTVGDWGLGIGDWGLGIGDWAQSPIPQSPIPNPQSPCLVIYYFLKEEINISKNLYSIIIVLLAFLICYTFIFLYI